MIGALAHGVKTSLVDGYRVERGKYAEIAHFGSSRSCHAVAVYRKIVGYVDIKNLVAGSIYH